jgi:tetraacyldisaccharide 4'-kinase
VAVITRGYGSSKTAEPLIILPGESVENIAARVGDEPALIRRCLPEVVIVKAARRVAGAEAAIERGCDTLILDDGFQHVALERDENVLVIDAANPFGNGFLVPRGILREPLSAMRRATHLLLTRCDQAGNLDSLLNTLQEYCPHLPLRKTRHAPGGLWRVCDGQTAPLESLRGAKVTALCGIGHPESFFKTLASLGTEIVDKHVFPDHGKIAIETIRTADRVITTEKDAMRLQNANDQVWALAINLEDIA